MSGEEISQLGLVAAPLVTAAFGLDSPPSAHETPDMASDTP